jgi:hypothetical protein
VSRRLLYLLLLLVVASALLFMRLPNFPTYAGRTIENAGHMPLFFLITLAILYVLREWRPFRDGHLHAAWLYGVSGLAGIGAGFLSEVIQRPLKRDASWEDVFADAVGAVCALAVYALFDRAMAFRRSRRLVAAVVVLVCATIYLAPIVNMARAYAHRNGEFPVLADFHSPVELFWTVSFGVRREIVDGNLAMDFVADEFPGLSFHEPVPDWRAFQTLVIDVENPAAEPFALGVRVHEIGHGREFTDRFNRHFEIAPRERRQLRIAIADIRAAPRERPMDMRRVSDITLFRTGNTGSRQITLHGMRLE